MCYGSGCACCTRQNDDSSEEALSEADDEFECDCEVCQMDRERSRSRLKGVVICFTATGLVVGYIVLWSFSPLPMLWFIR